MAEVGGREEEGRRQREKVEEGVMEEVRDRERREKGDGIDKMNGKVNRWREI